MVAALVAAVGCAQPADDDEVGGGPAASGAPAASGDPVVAFLAAGSFAGSQDPNAIQYTESEGLCTAERVIVALGVPRLEELGLDVAAGRSPVLEEPPLTVEEADQVFAAMGDCVDMSAQLEDMLVRGNLNEDDAACVAEEFLATGLMRRTLLASTANQPAIEEVDAALGEAGDTCGVSGVGILPPG